MKQKSSKLELTTWKARSSKKRLWVHLLIHSFFSKYLMGTYYVADTVLDSGGMEVNETERESLTSWSF